jgi:hypothetical protein
LLLFFKKEGLFSLAFLHPIALAGGYEDIGFDFSTR